MRLIVHAGFPKTATTTLQATLKANRARLPEGVRYLPHDDPDVMRARRWAVGVGKGQGAEALRWFGHAFGRLLDAAAIGPGETMILSAEDFSGGMPRRKAERWYPAAAPLAAAIAAEGARRGLSVELVYSTRERHAWLRSIHGQLRVSKRAVPEWEEWLRQPAPASFAWEPLLDEIRAAVAVPVHAVALEEDRAGPVGPGSTLLSLAGVEAADLRGWEVAEPRNVTPGPDVQARLQAPWMRRLPHALRRPLRRWMTRG